MDKENGLLELKEKREKIIVKTSVIGIVANLVLVIFKGAIGLISNSIAVLLDAVNNLSDALSSVITIVGTKLAAKKPNKKHPLGYGRIEYITAMIVAAIVIYAGIDAAIESVKKIIHPEKPDYSVVSLVIISVAVVVKLLLGRYVKAKGKEVNSASLVASGSDATFDAILSGSVFACALLFMLTGISLEAYVGIVISAFIIKAGIEMLFETLDDVLGKRPSAELSHEIKNTICGIEGVHGAYDLFLHSYGPERTFGSVHIEIDDNLTATDIDKLTRHVTGEVYRRHGVILEAVGIYSHNTDESGVGRIKADIYRTVTDHEGVLQVHGFYLDEETKNISFDIILDYSLKNRDEIFAEINRELKEKYPDYTINTVLDIDL